MISIMFFLRFRVVFENISIVISFLWYSKSSRNFHIIEKIMNNYHFIVLNFVILLHTCKMKTQKMCECQNVNFNKNVLVFFSSNYINWILIATFAKHICENCILTHIMKSCKMFLSLIKTYKTKLFFVDLCDKRNLLFIRSWNSIANSSIAKWFSKRINEYNWNLKTFKTFSIFQNYNALLYNICCYNRAW